MLAVFGLYILMRREKIAVGTLVIMGLAFCASIGVLLLSGARLSLGTDIKYFIKYCYNITMLFAYISLFRSLCRDKAEFVEKLFNIVRYTVSYVRSAFSCPMFSSLAITPTPIRSATADAEAISIPETTLPRS